MISGMKMPLVRDATIEDIEGINSVLLRNNLVPFTMEVWKELWQTNPALTALPTLTPFGWVLDAEGLIVGFLGGIRLIYVFLERCYSASDATSWAVDPQYRRHALELLAKYIDQADADLLINTTASPTAELAFKAFGVPRIPQPEVDQALILPIKAQGFIASILRKRGLPAFAAWMGGLAGALPLRIGMLLKARGPRRRTPVCKTEVIESGEIGPEFDELWHYKRMEAMRLLGDRSAGVLRWHLGVRPPSRPAEVITARTGKQLVGYVILNFEDNQSIGLRRARIADVFVKDDNPNVIDDLLLAALVRGQVNGADILEMVGFPRPVRERFLLWNPFIRMLPSSPYLCLVRPESLRDALKEGSGWFMCPYDGDASF
jgi:hypothetical protein